MVQILLLEDDPIDRELIETALKNGGITSHLTCVNHRATFIKNLSGSLPDLILADYVLPNFDGATALDLAKEICPQVPFILVSGVLGEEQAIDALKRGATDYVLKQRLERLVPAVKRALRESEERQERQKVTKALQETDELLRAIVEASPVGIITLDREQQVMTWNTAAEDLYGWSEGAVRGHSLPIIADAQRVAFESCFAQALNNQKVANQECQHLKADGGWVDVSLSLAPLHDADNDVYGVVMTAVDITVRKQIEAQRLSLLKQESSARAAAESANRIKDEFLAVLSHELRTPLNAIVGWIKLIQRGNLKPAVLQRALDTIERNAIAQTQLIEDLLDLSRIVRGQVHLSIRPVDITNLIRATVDTLRPAAEAKSITFQLDLATDLMSILADPNRLQQVFWNLLSNAIKFTPTGGQVAIRAMPKETDLHIQVSDTGIGISSDFLPHVFDHFRQADSSATRSQGGLGLGLSITRSLVELHGGTIQVESAGMGQGTTFTITLPMRVALFDTRESSQEASADNGNLKGIKILVIDDDADALELLTFILEEQGACLVSATSVQTALSMLENFRPNIIISDISMPDQDGYSLFEQIRSLPNAELADTPVIALTAYARAEDRDHALAAGFCDHIAKPFDPSEIVDAVYNLIHS